MSKVEPGDTAMDILAMAYVQVQMWLLAPKIGKPQKPIYVKRAAKLIQKCSDAGKSQSFRDAVTWRLKKMGAAMSMVRDWPIIVAAEVNREGGKVLSPAAALDEIILYGKIQGAGWYAGYDRFTPQFSMIKP